MNAQSIALVTSSVALGAVIAAKNFLVKKEHSGLLDAAYYAGGAVAFGGLISWAEKIGKERQEQKDDPGQQR